jgi:alpha-D-ribose 1-methylphosphonate 5-triphosphate synthase subunit PhnG
MALSTEDRQRFLGVLAKAVPEELERLWEALALGPTYRHLRAPESGLVMLRGRVSGTGAPFNMGEMTVTRCSVVLANGTIGHGYVGGTDTRHAEIVALCDALLQGEAYRAEIERGVIAPLVAARDAARQRTAARTAATRVEFFTVAREAGA